MPLTSPPVLLGGFILSAVMFATAFASLRRGADSQDPRRAEAIELALPNAIQSESPLRRRLFQAGFSHPEAPRRFLQIKVALSLCSLAVGLAVLWFLPALAEAGLPAKFAVLIIAAMPGFLLPSMVVDKRRQAWLRRIETALPDALDFMLICVEAGQSTDLAVLRVAEELRPVHPDLSVRFSALTEALTAGADRHEAWARLARETSNDDLRQLSTIILQSGSMGTPVAHTLRVFSADLRDRRVRRIEERANVLPTKMTLGTMMFTIPPLLILLLAPALFRIAQTF